MNQLEREVEANRSLYQTFSARAKDANHGEGIGAAVIASISDPALTIPSSPVFPRTKFTLQLSFILSLLGFSFLAVMFEKYRNTVQDVDSVVKKLGLPMLGLVPLVRQKSGNKRFRTPIIPGRYEDYNGLFEESFKTIRTGMYLASKDDKFIMVSSTLPSEGKSTVALNLAHSMSLVEKVLLIEADMRRPTLSLVRNLPLRQKGLSNYLRDDIELDKCISHIPSSNLDILPAHIDLVGAEIEIINLEEREFLMKKAIESLRSAYDFIIIDCSPSLGLITVNSLCAADSVIVPVQCEYFALEGLGKLLNTIKIVQSRLNPDLGMEGILLTMYDTRLRLANQVVEEVKIHFQQLVFDTVIHRNTTLGEAPSHGETVIMHDASSKGAINYLNLAREILQKNKLTKLSDEEKMIAFENE